MTSARRTMLALVAGMVFPCIIRAQGEPRRPIELGMDAALAYQSSDAANSTSFTLPVPIFRIGFHMSDAISFEPSLSFRYARVTFEDPFTGEDETSSGSSYELNVGLLYHFSPSRTQKQTYIRPFVGIAGFSGEDNSASQPSIGVALGIKVPAANRLGTRFEFGFSHGFEDEPTFEDTNRIFGSIGLSFFTR